MTQAMPVLQGRWCPSCGTGVGWQDEVCPSCGMPLERTWGAPEEPSAEVIQEPDAAEALAGEPQEVAPVVDDTSDTRAIPRIESAIPPEDDPESKVLVQERLPRTRALVLASVASALLMIGLALWLTHPWDPDIYSIRATEEKDTSMAGFPGTVESLSGQDNNTAAVVEVPSGDDATLAQLTEAYEKLGRYRQRADESVELFYQVAFSDNLDERTRGKREAQVLAIDVSNLIDTLGQVDVTSGTYADTLDNMLTLGNWLRNRVDRISDAWEADLNSNDPAADEQMLRSKLEADNNDEGKNAYQVLFEENYEKWKPEKKGE